jgi:lipopolysaccharide/colanic/teichoic acid biosynthesis glycosyltransferase
MPFIIPIVCVIHRLASTGTLFYLQRRSGLHNRPFVLIKFRTMHSDQEGVIRQLWPDDARLFPAGRVLRKLSLDELPQLLNVLRGEMSLIG